MPRPRLVDKRAYTSPLGTWGMISVGGDYPLWVSMAPPWLDNRVGLSCIKPGIYPIKVHRDYVTRAKVKLGDVIELIGEERTGRAGVLYHVATWASQLEGCGSAGKSIRESLGRPGLYQSRVAIDQIIRAIIEHGIQELEILQINGG